MGLQKLTDGNIYLDQEKKKLDKNKLGEVRSVLQSVNIKELRSNNVQHSIMNHRTYLSVLRKFREALSETDKFKGVNFNKNILSLLSVGSDGIYTNDLGFIYELIQNADDCKYINPEDRELNIHFDFNGGKIILEYNEVGFTPNDVFALTGIWQTEKNTSQYEKIEIGEKGIGFKSVFGVADKVLVQSGYFSFMLFDNNFTVPYEQYDGFRGINGTRLTLFIKPKTSGNCEEKTLKVERYKICCGIFEKLVDEYCEKTSLFNKNPILFLNNLTKINIYYDGFDSLEFNVSRGQQKTETEEGIIREDSIEISSVVSSRKKKIEKQETKIVCTLYTMPIKYNREMCVSRYGTETKFESRNMELKVIVPNPDHIHEIKNGTLYSFLPTQVATNVPVSCHIPFKLDASREGIDSQEENEWFRHSRDEFAKMLHYVYTDWAKIVKKEILYYIPNYKGTFFRITEGNDKLVCLKTDMFKGEKFLNKPILYTEDNRYKSVYEVFSFDKNILDPKTLYLLLNYNKDLGKDLFIAPEKINVRQYGIDELKEKDVYQKLFTHAIQDKISINKALDLLDKANVSYSELIEELPDKKLSFKLLVGISRHSKCFDAFKNRTVDKVKKNLIPDVEITHSEPTEDIRNIISESEPISESDFDKKIARLFAETYKNYNYITAEFEKEKSYFVSKNILVLSKTNALKSFAQFCSDIGENDVFSAILNMRSESKRLNEADDSMSVPDYMKLLRDVRKGIKTAFGEKDYQNYIKIIKELKSDPKRFIYELVQNADDCDYPAGEIPCFKLTINGNIIITEYNECGFKKENVRSITAIGESTKKKLSESKGKEIGEKGIGFKTVFALADSVDIHSNDFHFRLDSNTPTIPEIIDPLNEKINGTKMIFKLREPLPNTLNFLELCLCLRKLKDIKIGNTQIKIEEKENKRIINVEKPNDKPRQFCFDIYKHSAVVSDEALSERSKDGKIINKTQEIIFYVLEKQTAEFKNFLYCGLPTTIELGVPLIADVPFELTASRDNIIQNSRWNTELKREMYTAYADMLEKIARKSGINVMQYIRFRSLLYGSKIEISLFENDTDEWLGRYNILDILKKRKFIPTYLDNFFAAPEEAYIYPSIIHNITDKSQLNEYEKSRIINDPENEYDGKLKNLGCKPLNFREVTKIIRDRAHLYIRDNNFRKKLYNYLSSEENSELRNYTDNLKAAKIIPVKSKSSKDEINYVSFDEMKICVDETAEISPPDYGVLDTKILQKNILERILSEEIKVLDEIHKKSQYSEKLKSIITSDEGDAEKYKKLINELKHNREQFIESRGIILIDKNKIPLQTKSGEYRSGNVFTTPKNSGYFAGKILKSHIASEEATALAKLMDCRDISLVSYQDLDIREQLTADDIEDLQMEEISNGYSILQKSMFDGYISEELIEKYNLEGIKRIDYIGVFDENDFPNEPVKNLNSLRSRIDKIIINAREIIKSREYRTVDKIKLSSGREELLDKNENREKTLKRYRPAQNTDACFCQMCLAIKDKKYIEVNNILKEPKYYWPEMRISLCLECSKRFEYMRNDERIIEQFYENIKSADIQSKEPVSISIGTEKIRFTQTHLAVIQGILKSDKVNPKKRMR